MSHKSKIFFEYLREFFVKFFWILLIFLFLPIFILLPVIFYTESKLFNIFSSVSIKTFPKRQIVPYKDLKISIIIPHFNKIGLLDRCLDSLLKSYNFKNEDNEIVVVDDGSSNESVDFIKSEYPTVKVLENVQNKGFAYSCNRGVDEAKNELIILLNNDVIVTKDFLLPLVEHFKKDDVFAVTPKIYTYNRKTFIRGMEVGEFRQGYFRFWNEKDISTKEKIYQTSPTLYAIGACMAFRRKDFLWLGGFDKIYSPHWWEDIDICYRASKRGLKVLYEPKSLIYHKEGASVGKYKGGIAVKNEFLFIFRNFTDKKFIFDFFKHLPQIIYNGKFNFFYGFLLSLKQLPITLLHRFNERRYTKVSDKNVLRRTSLYYKNFKKRDFRIQKPEKQTILLLSPFFPYPIRHGLQVKVLNTIKSLHKHYNIILLTFYRDKKQLNYLPELKLYCKEIKPIKYKINRLSLFKKIIYPASIMKWFYNFDFKNCLLRILSDYPIDMILIESSFLIQYVRHIEGFPNVLVEHDPSILSFKNSFVRISENKLKRIFEWIKIRFYLNNMYRKFDKIFVFTKQDKNLLLRLNHSLNIRVVPIGIDLDYYSTKRSYKKDIDLLFIGSFFHYPNIDGVKFFLTKVYPILKSKIGKLNFKIVGSGVSKDKLKSILGINRDPNIEILGEVSDIRDYLYRTKVFVAPIRLGRGMKVKILEAMASGVPIVTTSNAIKGVKVRPGKDLLVADDPLSMVNNIIKLWQDERFAQLIARNAKKVAKSNYDNKQIKTELYQNIVLC